jgi:chromosome condensin MukBEF ATPase and DNA-binding subunit MukB
MSSTRTTRTTLPVSAHIATVRAYLPKIGDQWDELRQSYGSDRAKKAHAALDALATRIEELERLVGKYADDRDREQAKRESAEDRIDTLETVITEYLAVISKPFTSFVTRQDAIDALAAALADAKETA